MSTPFLPTTVINGVSVGFDLTDFAGAITGKCDHDGPGETIKFKCFYADRYNLQQALLPVTGYGSNGFFRAPPFQHPDNSNLYARNVTDVRGMAPYLDGSGWLRYRYAQVTVEFSPYPCQFFDGNPAGQNDASGQAWTVTTMKPSCEVYQPTGGSYFIGPYPSTTPLDEASVGLLRAQTEINVTRLMMPTMPDVSDAMGSVNQVTMKFAKLGYLGPEKYLLVACEQGEPYFDAIGLPVLDVKYTYLGRENSWNAVQNRAGSWQLLNTKADGTGTTPFSRYDFSTLPR